MRIAIGGILHESNTFVQLPTDLQAFETRAARGDEIPALWGDTHHEVAGFVQGGAQFGFEIYPTLMCGVNLMARSTFVSLCRI